MKRLFILISAAVMSLSACNVLGDLLVDMELTGRVDVLDNRISALEKTCREMNENLEALNIIITAMNNRDYVTNFTSIDIDGEHAGYVITFAQAGAVTIYHGEDGKPGSGSGAPGADGEPGADGADGMDAAVPVIGVRQDDTDGCFYWTLDGEWLLGENGEKILAEGPYDPDAQPGQDGSDGADGADGITPQLKIDDEWYWCISYDGGSSWERLGKVTGAEGSGNSLFREVAEDAYYLRIVLRDGTELMLPKEAPLTIRLSPDDNPLLMIPNSTIEVWYAIEGLFKEAEIEVISSADLKVRIIPMDPIDGTIEIKTSETIDEYSHVTVFVTSGSRMITKTINVALNTAVEGPGEP